MLTPCLCGSHLNSILHLQPQHVVHTRCVTADLSSLLLPVGADAGASGPTYRNSPDADKYLAMQSPDYMGGHTVLYHDR